MGTGIFRFPFCNLSHTKVAPLSVSMMPKWIALDFIMFSCYNIHRLNLLPKKGFL